MNIHLCVRKEINISSFNMIRISLQTLAFYWFSDVVYIGGGRNVRSSRQYELDQSISVRPSDPLLVDVLNIKGSHIAHFYGISEAVLVVGYR